MKFCKASTTFVLFIALTQVRASFRGFGNFSMPRPYECKLSQELIEEIASYKSTVEMIIKEVTSGRFKGSTYKFLVDFIDTFGNRITGSQNLENSIDYMLELSKKHNLENVHGEKVLVPHWIRGHESAAMLEPRYQKLNIRGFGLSMPTPPEGIRAYAIAVSSFTELYQVRKKVPGKIVVYNRKFSPYFDPVDKAAAEFQAVAVLHRSPTNLSLSTPHILLVGKAKIPQAAITPEDTIMLLRRCNRGESVLIELKMASIRLADTISRNTIADLTGHENPDSVVIVTGHLDSWDLGDGVVDNAGGALLSWNSVVTLKALNLRPRRTLRAALFTGEEQGRYGSIAYSEQHKREKINFVLESDLGTFTPLGLDVVENAEGECILAEILKLFKSINATSMGQVRSLESDADIFIGSRVPAAGLKNKNERYYWYYHSDADRLEVADEDTLDLCTAFWAGVSYIISDLSVDMPRLDSDFTRTYKRSDFV